VLNELCVSARRRDDIISFSSTTSDTSQAAKQRQKRENPKLRASVVPSGLYILKSFPRVPSLRSVTRGYALTPLRGLETSAQSAHKRGFLSRQTDTQIAERRQNLATACRVTGDNLHDISQAAKRRQNLATGDRAQRGNPWLPLSHIRTPKGWQKRENPKHRASVVPSGLCVLTRKPRLASGCLLQAIKCSVVQGGHAGPP
jgi:hypothetical protein